MRAARILIVQSQEDTALDLKVRLVHMTVIANGHTFSGKSNQAFYVKQSLIQSIDSLRFEHDNVSTFRTSKIIGQPIHEQMIPGLFPETNQWFPFYKPFSNLHSRAPRKSFVRCKPYMRV